MKKNLLYSLSCLSFAIIIGGAVYEHLNIVPKWSAAPPVSLAMFQGEHGLQLEIFWKIIHPVNLILFAVTLVMHWRTERKKPLVTVLVAYLLILVITTIYFVPELISITTTAYAQVIDPALVKRASLWETLSLIRLAVLVVLSQVLYFGLTKDNQPKPIPVKRKGSAVPAMAGM